ncbi:hypothetical protein [Alkalibacterium sp. AK22]|uniref:hypothetical protein n=1 Tax=Alkalibacterium sp. AK22 TaxID=1229520 RepID=UPI00055092DE|nr:hypothetical protein [Alkalibacterium sp. AK22]
MASRDANLFGLKLGLTVLILLFLPNADTALWVNLLMGALQGIGINVILDKLLGRFHTEEYNRIYK